MRTRKTPPHTQRERDGERGRGTNKVCVLDACNKIEDCRREREREREREGERERESRSPGEGEVVFYKPCFDIK